MFSVGEGSSSARRSTDDAGEGLSLARRSTDDTGKALGRTLLEGLHEESLGRVEFHNVGRNFLKYCMRYYL